MWLINNNYFAAQSAPGREALSVERRFLYKQLIIKDILFRRDVCHPLGGCRRVGRIERYLRGFGGLAWRL